MKEVDKRRIRTISFSAGKLLADLSCASSERGFVFFALADGASTGTKCLAEHAGHCASAEVGVGGASPGLAETGDLVEDVFVPEVVAEAVRGEDEYVAGKDGDGEYAGGGAWGWTKGECGRGELDGSVPGPPHLVCAPDDLGVADDHAHAVADVGEVDGGR